MTSLLFFTLSPKKKAALGGCQGHAADVPPHGRFLSGLWRFPGPLEFPSEITRLMLKTW